MTRRHLLPALVAGLVSASAAFAQIAVTGAMVHTAAGEPLNNAVVVIEDGKISRVGPASEIEIPDGFRTMTAAVVTPGLIDARSTLGLSGYLNQAHDQDQVETSDPVQPELRAIDAYNPREALVEWVRGYGVTTIHTGHAPRSLISGQTAVLKTRGLTLEEALVKPMAMIAATFGEGARERGNKAPGTRAKMAAMLRAELIKAREYVDRRSAEDEAKRPDRDLRLEALGQVLEGNVPLLVTAQLARDILTVLRIREEFDIPIVLDGAAEAYDVLEQIREAGVPVIVHPTMMRAQGETENLSFETAARLYAAGIPAALQGGYEAYVPKSRLVLFEAGVAAAHGLGFDDALRSITINAARVLGLDNRIGSIEVGKDGDLALYDGDPFEYSTHCVAVIIEGEVVSEEVPVKLVLNPEVEAARLAQITAAAAPMRVANCTSEAEAIAEIADADGFFGNLTPAMLAAAHQLRWVQSPTASLEHYVFPALAAHPLQLTNMRGLFYDNIADHVFGCMLCFARNLHIYVRQQQRREWRPYGGRKEGQSFRSGPAVTTGIDLAHTTLSQATLGVVGLGSIGSEIARRGVCFGMRVLALDSDPRDAPAGVIGPWGPGRLDDLLAESDYVVIAAPHTPETEGLFRADKFARMKSSGVLINIGRGVIVNLDDLCSALEQGEIGGAALDVYEIEPLPAEHRLWSYENVILTPHVAGHSPAIAGRHLDVLLDNAGRFVRGEPLRNIVDKQRWF